MHVEAPSARGVRATWIYTLASIVIVTGALNLVLVLAVLAAVGDGARSGWSAADASVTVALAVTVVAAAVVHLRYCWFLRAGLGGGLPDRAWTVAVLLLSALAWVLGLAVPGLSLLGGWSLWISINLIAPLLQRRARWLLLVAGALATLAHPALAARLHDHPLLAPAVGDDWFPLVYGLLLPLLIVPSVWWWEVVIRLDRSRRTAAELAVARERLRFASDLHDIQGHHLQVIALKAELAERLLPTDADAAAEHIHETRVIARRALEETRSLVHAYRQVGLEDELENAREVLTAAGARCDMRLDALPAEPEIQRALAMVVREATTNILRHSAASEVWVRLDAAEGTRLVIGNDGGPAGQQGAGSGLAGLRDRMAAVGGRLDAGPRSDGSFEVVAWAPAGGATA